jgi:hypothetical protein
MRGRTDVHVGVAIGARVTIILLLFGAAPAALAIAVATTVWWALSRSRLRAGDQEALVTSPHTGSRSAVREPAERS